MTGGLIADHNLPSAYVHRDGGVLVDGAFQDVLGQQVHQFLLHQAFHLSQKHPLFINLPHLVAKIKEKY